MMKNDLEAISDLVDGESQIGTLARNLDENSRAAWSRYHIIGDVIRDSDTPLVSMEFADRVSDQIAQEPTVLAPNREPRSVMRPLAGFAIAASVAALAVIGVRQWSPESDPIATASIVRTAPQVADATVSQVPARQPTIALEPQVVAHPSQAQRRLNSYLVKFNEQRSSLAVPGVNPYVRIVGFETE